MNPPFFDEQQKADVLKQMNSYINKMAERARKVISESPNWKGHVNQLTNPEVVLRAIRILSRRTPGRMAQVVHAALQHAS